MVDKKIRRAAKKASAQSRLTTTELVYEKYGVFAKTGELSDLDIWDDPMFTDFRNTSDQTTKAILQGVVCSSGEYKCKNKKCGSDKCYIYELQTRSADESMTRYVMCTQCGKQYVL